jgi:hypothetical protein
MQCSSALAMIALTGAIAAGCGANGSGPRRDSAAAAAAVALDLSRTRPLGSGSAFRPPALANPLVAASASVGRMRCQSGVGRPYGAHIELFAREHQVAIPAGIGIAPPRHMHQSVVGGRCVYPLRTTDPTGVVEVDRGQLGQTPTVGELFRVWGQPLSRRRLAGFAGTGPAGVVAFVDGRRWRRDPAAIPLSRHAQIVLELDAPVAPHPTYTFPPGL